MTGRRARSSTNGLRASLRSVAKELVWLGVRHRPGEKKDICVFCTRRGGSTWLMETIAANRGVLPMNQPVEILSPNMTPEHYRRLPKFDRGQVVHPDPDQEQELREYTDDLMAGRLRVNAPHAFWRPDFSFRTDRLLLKILDAKPMMDWFDQNYDVSIAYLVRHPVPQALSCARNGWGTTTRAYTRNEWFVEEVLGDRGLRDHLERLDREGSPLQRYVANWAVENLYPLRVLSRRPEWTSLSYEECVVDRDRVFEMLCRRLDLSDVERMERSAARASRSSSLSSQAGRDAIRTGDRTAQVSAWTDQVTREAQGQVADILERCGITLYSAFSSMPDWTGYRAD